MAEEGKVKWCWPDGELYLGNCLEVMKTLPKKSVDLVFGSPPYEDARSYDINFSLKGQDWVDWMVEVFKESLRVCKGLVAFVVGHGRKGASQWTGVPVLLAADLIRKGIRLRNPAIYKRDSIPGSGGHDWLKANYEWIICAAPSKRLPWSNNKAMGHEMRYKDNGDVSYRKEDGKKLITRTRISGMKDGDTRDHYCTKVVTNIANPGLIIDCGATGGGKLGSDKAHEGEAPFPEKLPIFFIRSFCPEGGIVLDPFVGSGTTVASAIKWKRNFMGIDIRESQIQLTKRRIKEARSKLGFGLKGG